MGACRKCWTQVEDGREVCDQCLLDIIARKAKERQAIGFAAAAKKTVLAMPAKRKLKRPQPTNALPGSPEKIGVLMGRLERGEYLFHELDARMDEG